MQVKKALLVTGATTIVGLSSFAGVASAASSTSTGSGQSLAEKIATKFHLNKTDVQTVIDEDRQQHEADRQQRLEDRLSQAVTDGKITSAQKDQILAKLKELRTYMDSIQDKTPSERRQLMQTKMDELRKWASDNGLSAYMPMGPHGHGGGFGGHGLHGDDMPADAGTMGATTN